MNGNNGRSGSRKRDNDINGKNNSFRKISICPKREDIHIRGLPYIERNIINGKYNCIEHYLEVQFRLLREDFVRPLRNGIKEYINAINNNKPYNRIDGIRVYTNVRISVSQNDYVFKAEFDVSNLNTINWQNSKRLIYGSLVCISGNNFNTFSFATVTGERDLLNLAKGQFELQFETKQYEQLINVFPLTIIESEVYFEAYRHNLLALKSFDSNNFPFEDYIINVSNNIANNPYLKPKTVYNLSELMKCDNESSRSGNFFKRVNIMNDNEWPKAEAMGFDESQYKAFKFALRKQFVVIQGPPGTGKTHIGLKIVQTLLLNKKIWNRTNETQFVNRFKVSTKSPILVVCYTNHALDQFLEGMLSFTDSMIRIGGRSKSEGLEKHTLKYLKNEKIESLSSVLNSIKTRFIESESKVMNCRTDLLNLNDLNIIMKESWIQMQTQSLKLNYFSDLRESLLKWLMNSIFESEAIETNSDEDLSISLSSVEIRSKEVFNIVSNVFENNCQTSDRTVDCYEFNNEFDANKRELDNILEDRSDIELHCDFSLLKVIDSKEYFESQKTNIRNDNEKLSKQFTKKQLIAFNSELKYQLSLNDIMDRKEAINITDVTKLSQSDRWRLYKYWIHIYSQYFIRELKKCEQEYSEETKRLKRLENESNLSIVMNYNPDIIGMTTTGAAKFRYIITEIRPRIVVIEEAAEVFESHVITSLTDTTEHLILIGDHKQLRPKPAVHLLAKKFGLDVSLFERMIKNGLPFHQLKVQHRMRPKISSLLKPHIYKELDDHQSVKQYDNIKGISENMYFISHEVFEESNKETTSKMNEFEAELIVRLCKHLVLQDYETSKITILTMYSAQLFLIKDILKRESKTSDLLDGISAHVLDSFQGEENDIILISFVRSNDMKDIGFLKVANRINVALSRAKKGLYCIGNFNFLSNNSQLWFNIRKYLIQIQSIGPKLELYCQKHPNNKTEVSKKSDFENFRFGGCGQPCAQTLGCGHICRLSCHTLNHIKLKCDKQCAKIVCHLNHLCPNVCHFPKECDPCIVEIEKCLDKCGHTIIEKCSGNQYCYEIVEKVVPKCGHKITEECSGKCFCNHSCDRILDCGHKCQLKCGDKCDPNLCPQIIEKVLQNCGHKIIEKCSENLFCYNPCEKSVDCGHKCSLYCSDNCTSKPCKIIVEKLVQKCGHYVKMECSQDMSVILCQNSCERRLICGHKCPKLCHEKCKQFWKCSEKCYKIICDQNHKCSQICHFNSKCKPCYLRVEKTFPNCHHKVVVFCSTDISSLMCHSICEKTLECSHKCLLKCYEKCSSKSCQVLVEKQCSNCGNPSKVKCSQDITQLNCEIMCKKVHRKI